MMKLEPLENKILTLIAQGFENKQIAEKLAISLSTVRVYCTDIYMKLDIKDGNKRVRAANIINNGIQK